MYTYSLQCACGPHNIEICAAGALINGDLLRHPKPRPGQRHLYYAPPARACSLCCRAWSDRHPQRVTLTSKSYCDFTCRLHLRQPPPFAHSKPTNTKYYHRLSIPVRTRSRRCRFSIHHICPARGSEYPSNSSPRMACSWS
jgi:hypothetical protein